MEASIFFYKFPYYYGSFRASKFLRNIKCSLAQLAVAWVIANKDVSTCILGASKASQLDENFKALEIYKKLTPEILTEIETILGNCPAGEMDFRDRCQLNVRRNIDLGVNLVKK